MSYIRDRSVSQPGHIRGMVLSYVSATQVQVGVGVARDDDDTLDIDVSAALTLDITASGALGIDTGTESAAKWYAVWVIAKTDGTVSAVLSLSSTVGGVTMPTDYTLGRRVGWIRNDSGGDILTFEQRGIDRTRRIHYDAPNESLILVNGTAAAFTVVSAASFVPPTVDDIVLLTQFESGSSGVAADSGRVRPNGSVAVTPTVVIGAGVVSASKISGEYTAVTDGSQLLEYKVSRGGASQNQLTLYVVSYWDEL